MVKLNRLVFFWENIGPVHADRLSALADSTAGRAEVAGIQLRSASAVYDWDAPGGDFQKVTLFTKGSEPGVIGRLFAIIASFSATGRADYFFGHYEWPELFLAAWFLRLTGSRVYAMIDSKFDDKPRRLWFEAMKSFMFTPYSGALVGSRRTEEYLRFLGMRGKPIAGDFDTISIDRIRRLAGAQPAPDGVAHADRHLVCVARLVPKKNHATLFRAYAEYRSIARAPRELHLYGNGPEEQGLKALAAELGIVEHVHFHGFVQTEGVSQMLGRALALLLPSTEEQFGQVILEAQAMGLPVIVSDNVGARDKHVRTGVNGFVVEPHNVAGIARFMAMLSDDEELWRSMAQASLDAAPLGDVANFVASVETLVQRAPRGRLPHPAPAPHSPLSD